MSSNPTESERFWSINPILNSQYVVGNQIAGFVEYPEKDSDIWIISGTKPVNDYDIIISDLCSTVLGLGIGDRISIGGFDSFSVSGVYKAIVARSFKLLYSSADKKGKSICRLLF